MLTKVYAEQPFFNDIFKITLQTPAHRSYGSGVLLKGGEYVLTAAHLFSGQPALNEIQITNGYGAVVSTVAQIFTHPLWDNNPADYNHDLALIKLCQPLNATGYELYRDKKEIGQVFTRVGFSGTEIVAGKNTYDAFTDQINAFYGTLVQERTQLLYDYDNGKNEHDAIGHFLNLPHLGLGSEETMSQTGLSGGGTFIDGKLAGIGSYIFRAEATDVNGIIDSSVGELGSDTRIFAHLDWIDFITQGNPIYAPPSQPSQVIQNVAEPNFGSVVNYFLASFAQPLTHPIAFDFRTLDGAAIASIDYLATQGRIELQAGQDHVAIPVTIFGDKVAEADETFFLEVSNPVGFSLPNNALVLTAMHTIIDNDTAIF